MSTDLALTEDGLTVEFEGNDDRPDLTADEAEAVTGRIRRWVNDFPVEDVVTAFRGRVWLALSYASWSEWCECELGGLKLPAPKRREIVAELASEGMSNSAIAEALDVSKPTVARDLSGVTNVTPDGRLGPDGKTYHRPAPKSDVPQPETVDAEIVCRDCDGYGCETCFHGDGSEAIEESPDSDPTPVPNPADSQKKPREKPMTDVFWNAVFELGKAVERVERLSENERFEKNKDQISRKNRGDLVRARDALERVIEKFN